MHMHTINTLAYMPSYPNPNTLVVVCDAWRVRDGAAGKASMHAGRHTEKSTHNNQMALTLHTDTTRPHHSVR